MMMMMGRRSDGLMKLEGLLRVLALCTLALAAIVMGTDSQTKVLFGVYSKKASFKDVDVFISAVYVYSIGAGYCVAQLIRCFAFTKYQGDYLTSSSHLLKWTCFLLDQMAAYIVFATNCASTEMSVLAIFGAESLQWLKLCDKYTRLCFQIGGALTCSLLAWVFLVVISGISTFNLFRWYSPNIFCLKHKRIGKLST